MTDGTPLVTIMIGRICRDTHGDEKAIEEALERIRKTMKVQLARHPLGEWGVVLMRIRKDEVG